MPSGPFDSIVNYLRDNFYDDINAGDVLLIGPSTMDLCPLDITKPSSLALAGVSYVVSVKYPMQRLVPFGIYDGGDKLYGFVIDAGNTKNAKRLSKLLNDSRIRDNDALREVYDRYVYPMWRKRDDLGFPDSDVINDVEEFARIRGFRIRIIEFPIAMLLMSVEYSASYEPRKHKYLIDFEILRAIRPSASYKLEHSIGFTEYFDFELYFRYDICLTPRDLAKAFRIVFRNKNRVISLVE